MIHSDVTFARVPEDALRGGGGGQQRSLLQRSKTHVRPKLADDCTLLLGVRLAAQSDLSTGGGNSSASEILIKFCFTFYQQLGCI